MIQIKMLRDMNGMLRNHIYNVNEKYALQLVEHGCFKNANGEYKLGTGDTAVYYSVDNDKLHNSIAPIMFIPEQLRIERLLRVSDEKQPIDSKWPESTNTLENKPFADWIIDHEKYGVLCGGPNKLCVIDFDDKIIQQSVIDDNILPTTFSVRTARKKLLHLYYYISGGEIKSGPIKDAENKTLADIQFERRQVIGPGSRIPSGQCYEVVNDIPITTISADILHKALDRYNHTKTQEALQDVANGLTLDDFRPKFNDTSLSDIKRQLKISEVLRDAGISAKGSRGNTKCPFHNSVGGKCLAYDDNKDGGLWNCFNCGKGGDVFTLWMEVNHITDFADAKKQLCEKLGIEDKFVPTPLVVAKPNSKPDMQLPQKNRTVLDFATDLAIHFKNCDEIYYKVDEKCIVEIDEYTDKQLRQLIVSFGAISPGRLFNIIEWKVNTYLLERVKKDEVMVRQSANEQMIKLVSTNQAFKKCLREIKRLLNYPIPFIDPDNNLCIPTKGYDERYQAYFTPSCPEITLMSVDQAKFYLYDLLKEFCFKDERDRMMAMAYLITPMCRGLYRKSTARTPLFIIQANRERAGKDFMAGVVGTLYEGRAIDDTPFVTSEKENSNNTDEWRKKFTTALRAGRRRIHSSNNKGFLNNSALEAFLTSEVWIDRQLGGNISLELNNEIDVSLSANLGLTFTPDLWNRARPINLFYGEENPNERVYSRTDLWGYVADNRGLLLSAVYILIKTWFDAGKPKSTIPFTSFPEWSRVIGGLMEYHNMGNPCITIEDEDIGGDRETRDMKELFKFMAEYQHNHQDANRKGYMMSEIRTAISEAKSSEDFEGFPGWDLSDKAFQTKFGIMIRRFVGRSFNCKSASMGYSKVTLVVAVPNERSIRVLYLFKTDKVITAPPIVKKKDEPPAIMEEYVDMNPTIDVPINHNEVDMLLSIIADNGRVSIDYLISLGVSEKVINMCKARGIIYEPKPGYVELLR